MHTTSQCLGNDHLQQERLEVYESFSRVTLPIDLAVAHAQATKQVQRALTLMSVLAPRKEKQSFTQWQRSF
jgi:hypothetical protein